MDKKPSKAQLEEIKRMHEELELPMPENIRTFAAAEKIIREIKFNYGI